MKTRLASCALGVLILAAVTMIVGCATSPTGTVPLATPTPTPSPTPTPTPVTGAITSYITRVWTAAGGSGVPVLGI